jgi:hypothetical protein
MPGLSKLLFWGCPFLLVSIGLPALPYIVAASVTTIKRVVTLAPILRHGAVEVDVADHRKLAEVEAVVSQQVFGGFGEDGSLLLLLGRVSNWSQCH